MAEETSARVLRMRWLRVQLYPARAVRSSGVNSTSASRAPSWNAAKSKARRLPAGWPSHGVFVVTVSHSRWTEALASSGTSICTGGPSPSSGRRNSCWFQKSIWRWTKSRSKPGVSSCQPEADRSEGRPS